MNIAASNVIRPATQDRTDAAPSAGPGADTGADGDEGNVQGFGAMLSESIQKGCGSARPGAPVDGKTTGLAAGQPGGGAVAADATGLEAATEPRAPLDLRSIRDGKVDASRKDASDASKAAKAGDDAKDEPADPVATDVSAQLALASQWAGLSPAHVPVQNDPSASGKLGDPGDVTTNGDDRRASSGRVAATRAAAITPADMAQVQAAAIPVALNAAAFGVDRNARSSASTAGSAVAKSEDPKAEDTARLTTPESRTVSIDKLFNLAVGNPSTGSPDPASIASQFVTQVAAQVSNAQNPLGAVSTPAAAALHETVGSPAWSHELGQAALRMATGDLQSASLRLNPEHLGPLDVQMRIDNGVAHMQFAALHADTRHALESSRGTLDQMMSDQGLKLGDWSVGNSSTDARGFGAASSQGDGSRSSSNEADSAGADTISANVTTRTLGLVDTFA